MVLKTMKREDGKTCVILCGGESKRFQFELKEFTKPLAIINDIPIIHHILNFYAESGLMKHFLICLGYKGLSIKRSIETATEYENGRWRNIPIDLVDTGEYSTATSRIMQAIPFIEDENFILTYADVISNIDFHEFVNFHSSHDAQISIALTKAQMPYGKIVMNEENKINQFIEKPILEDWINAGYFIINTESVKRWNADLQFESEQLPLLLSEGENIYGYRHTGFWRGIDTYKDLDSVRVAWKEIKKLVFN